MTTSVVKTSFYTSFALIAFAVNSVLCRLALGEESSDAAGLMSFARSPTLLQSKFAFLLQ